MFIYVYIFFLMCIIYYIQGFEGLSWYSRAEKILLNCLNLRRMLTYVWIIIYSRLLSSLLCITCDIQLVSLCWYFFYDVCIIPILQTPNIITHVKNLSESNFSEQNGLHLIGTIRFLLFCFVCTTLIDNQRCWYSFLNTNE